MASCRTVSRFNKKTGKVEPYTTLRVGKILGGHETALGFSVSKETINRALGEASKKEALARAGVFENTECSWTLKTLSEWDCARKPGGERARRWLALLVHFGEETRLEDLSVEVLDAWVSRRLKAGIRATSLRTQLSLLHGALQRAQATSGFKRDPFDGLTLPEAKARKKPHFTEEQIETFLGACWELAEETHSPRTPRAEWRQGAQMIELLYRTGSRLRQVIKMRRNQIKDGILHFPAQKKGRPRNFALEGRLKDLIDAALEDSKGSEFLFPSQRWEGIPRACFDTLWAQTCQRVGLEMTPHALRGAAASHWFRSGRTVDEVQQLLGHTTPALAMTLYIQTFPKVLTVLAAPIPAPSLPHRKAVSRSFGQLHAV